jgi:hypothetical protein
MSDTTFYGEMLKSPGFEGSQARETLGGGRICFVRRFPGLALSFFW